MVWSGEAPHNPTWRPRSKTHSGRHRIREVAIATPLAQLTHPTPHPRARHRPLLLALGCPLPARTSQLDAKH